MVTRSKPAMRQTHCVQAFAPRYYTAHFSFIQDATNWLRLVYMPQLYISSEQVETTSIGHFATLCVFSIAWR